MKDATTKIGLIASGDQAFISLSQQIGHMLDVIDFFILRYPVSLDGTHDALAVKHQEILECINILGGLPRQMADTIRRWKHDEPRVLSKTGVELQVLNEIWITLDTLSIFFACEGIDLHPFDHLKAHVAFIDLTRVNRLLD